MAFETVAREWRCKYSPGASGGPGDSASLKACNDLLTEYLPKLKALEGAEVTRQVCGGCVRAAAPRTHACAFVSPRRHASRALRRVFFLPAQMDFKVSITQPLEAHGAFMEDLALEEEFMGKLKLIDGTSLHETQEITFVKM